MRRSLAAFALLLVPLAAPAADPAPDLTGRWSGYWVSDTTGHRGPLSATFRRVSDDCYRVRFRGRFWGVFPFRYATTMPVVGADGETVALAGEQRLGPVLGSFRYAATGTATDFVAAFQARGDAGRFVLTRR